MKQLFDNDNEILDALRSKAPERINAALKHLCQSGKLQGAVRQQVFAQRGDDNDAREMLNQALVAFLNHVEDGTYDSSRSAVSTYIVKIAAQMYFTKRRSEQRRLAMHDRSMDLGIVETETNPEFDMNLQHQKAFLDKLLQLTGDKCRQALQLYGHSYSMVEIADMLQYKSPDSAKMAVHDCRKKLNAFLSDRPDLLDELREL